MPIVGGLDIHRKQITFDYLDTATGEVRRGQIAPADRAHLRAWLARFAGLDDVAFALEGCTGWRYVAEELAAAGVAAHVAGPADTAFARGASGTPRPTRPTPGIFGCCWSRLPECWIPPAQILECRALLEAYHDLRREHTAWIERIHAVFFHQGAPRLGEGALRTGHGLAALREAAAIHLSPAGRCRSPPRWTCWPRSRPGWTRCASSCCTPPALAGPGRCRLGSMPWPAGRPGDDLLARRRGRFSSSRKAVRFAGLDVTVYSSDGKRSPGHLSRQGPEILRWVAYEAGRTHGRAPPPATTTTRPSRTAPTARSPPCRRPAG